MADFTLAFARKRWEHVTVSFTNTTLEQAITEAKRLTENGDLEGLDWDNGSTTGGFEIEIYEGGEDGSEAIVFREEAPQ